MEPADVPFLGKLADDVCLSGGAAGADVTWGKHAYDAGHQVVHWSYKGHKSHDPDNTYILTPEELTEADDHLKEANLTLKRRLDFNKKYIGLLQRNWYQVKYADSVYAVGKLNDKAVIYDPRKGHNTKYHITNDRKDRMGVEGGTAWACQMYLDRFRREVSGMNFLLVFYDQIKKGVYVYMAAHGCWMPIQYAPTGPVLERPGGVYAAIGSRDLKDNGAAFIEDMYNR